MIVCSNCSKARAYLAEIDTKNLLRVCDVCKDSKDLTFKIPSEILTGKKQVLEPVSKKHSDDLSDADSVSMRKSDGLVGWEPNEASSICRLCDSTFSFTNRKHHCRKCGRLVCGLCSNHFVHLDSSLKQLSRVCNDCYE
jgi:hypothetical protein